MQQFCYRLFPYPEVGHEPYRLAVSAISAIAKENEDIHSMLVQGINAMDSKQQDPWLNLYEAQQVNVMQEIEQGEFFQWTYTMALNQIFTPCSSLGAHRL